MQLILAIEPDRRQANQLRSMVRNRLEAELVLAESAERGLAALGDRIPDLILTSLLLSPKDEIALHTRLRALEGAASYVQTLTIPMLAATQPNANRGGGVLSALRGGRSRKKKPILEGCDPAVFAEQCAAYLERARAERALSAGGHKPLGASTEAPVTPHPADREPVAPAEWTDQPAWPVDAGAAATDTASFPREPEPEAPLPSFLMAGTSWDSQEITDVGRSTRTLEDAATPAPVAAEPNGPETKPAAPAGIQASEISALEPVAEPTAQRSTPIEAKAAPPLWLGAKRSWPALDGTSIEDGLAAEAAPDAPRPEVEPSDVDALTGLDNLVVLRADDTDPQAYEIDFGELTREDATDASGPISDTAWHAGGNEDSDAAVQTYEINVDELFVDGDPPATAAEARLVESRSEPAIPLQHVAVPLVGGRSRADEPLVESLVRAEPATSGTTLEAGEVESDPTPVEPKGEYVDIERELWAPLRANVHPLWPTLEGGLAEARAVAFIKAASKPAIPEPPAIPKAPPPAPAEPARPEWLKMVESLRRDMQRLQADWVQPVPPLPAPPLAAPSAPLAESAPRFDDAPVVKPVPATSPAATPVSAAKSVPAAQDPPAAPPVAAAAPAKTRSKGKKRGAKKKNPVQDQWGFFDPEQIGFTALLTKLDEITAKSDDPPPGW